MQQSVPPIPRNWYGLHTVTTLAALLAFVIGLTAIPGCNGDPPPAVAPRVHDGVNLTFNCPDATFADAIAPMVRSWEARTGAKVTLTRDAMTPQDATDLAVIPAGHLGAWAEPGHLAALPARFRAGDHPLRWFELLTAYSDRLVEWGAQTQAIPLTGDGYVVVYRADQLAEFTRPGPPATWEQFAEIADFFARRDKKPSLPPLPVDPERMFDFFSRVASSMDRRVLSDKDLDDPNKDGERLAFQFVVATGKPRLQSPGFQAAAKWFADLRAAGALPGPGSDDPIAALAENRAVLALVSLDQLARLPRENGVVSARFAIAAIPGSRPEKPEQNANYVPHFSGGRLGIVRKRCQHPEIAFDLLAEIGGPARSAELVATPGLGAGPTRSTHLTPDRLLLWLGYGFDETRSKDLQEALRHYVGQAVKNPTSGLRGPDRAELTVAAGTVLRKLGTGTKPGDALTQIMTAWAALDAKVPDNANNAKLVRWRQLAAGLN